MWGSREPADHHVAVPHQVLLAILSVCLVWGWVREAVCFSLTFGALLRPGEVVAASRADLLLPSDVNGTIKHVLLRIREPKTKLRAARHQVGKMERPDLITLVQLGFGSLKKHEKLWPLSAATLRQTGSYPTTSLSSMQRSFRPQADYASQFQGWGCYLAHFSV